MTARALVASALAALFLTLPVYWHGLGEGEVFNWEGADEFCPSRPGSELGLGPSNDISVLPLGNTCRYDDGVSVQLVPAWVNPVLFGLLAVAAVCLVAARRRAVGRGDADPG